ncbi:MAG: DUF4347 domain-containing protein, partial [Desulfovibrionales bacterium]|nr:DUF4347 domain-containing protein [Desulfovibrionales bacterium]
MSHSSFFQLEPRLLFDASVADATDHTMDDGGVAAEFPGLAYVQDDAQAHAYHDDHSGDQHIYDERAGLDAPTAEIPRIDIFVIDASVKDVEAIEKALPADAIVIHLDAGSDGILTLSEALAQYDRVDALHILSHGSDGQISLGGTLLNEATLVERGAEIAAWSNAFTDTGDILIYGCDVAQTAKGEAFVQDLADLTGTDVAASINPTGAEDKGGDWVLETATGPIEAGVLAAMGYDGLMEAPKPDASIAVSNTAPLIGTDVTLTLTFDNQSADEVGYGPYVDLFINHKGADGNTTDLTKSDGLNFKSATFFGTNVEHKLYTLTNDVPVGDQLQISDGKIIHPITGEEISVPDGFGVGDQLLVVTLPFGSFTPDQLASVDVTLTVDQKADPDIALKVASVGGFILGKDALHNPESDPPIRQTTVHELSITPQAFTVETFMDAPEGETVTGPNFVRHVDIVITPAPGTVMTGDTTVYFTLPDGVVLADGFVAPAGWEIVTLPVYDTDLTNDTLVLKLVDGQDITDPTTITVPVYVTEKYQTGADILNPATGEQATINFTNVEVKGGQWFGV